MNLEVQKMRKLGWLAGIVLLISLLLASAAMADPAQGNLPDEILKLLPHPETAVQQASLTGTGKVDFWFVTTEEGNSRVLYCFRNAGKGWKESFHTNKAVPQGKNFVELYISRDGIPDAFNGQKYKGPVFVMWLHDSPAVSEESDVVMSAIYRLSDQNWNIVRYWNRDTKTSVSFAQDSLTYYRKVESNRQEGTVTGTVQRNIRYLNLSSIPKNYDEAERKITSAPVLPANSELRAQEIQFTGGKKYEVYSGPGKNTLRNGKAAVSTNGWIQVFGRDGDWILIQYSIDSSRYRFGYIPAASLPKDAYVSNLGFGDNRAVIAGDTAVTDDPLYSRGTLTTVAAGTEVNWLATMGEWAYIDGGNFRGFVPLSALNLGGGSSSEASGSLFVYTAANGEQNDLFEIRKLLFGADRRITGVSGVYGHMKTEEEFAAPAYADDEKVFTYELAPDFRAEVADENGDGLTTKIVDAAGFYAWYVEYYLAGEAPAGDMTFLYDLPAADREFAQTDFWFVTTRIRLNEQNQITYMEYVYVPWG